MTASDAPRPPVLPDGPDHLLRNQTAYRICIAPNGGAPGDGDRILLQLPPYGEVGVSAGELAHMDLEPWVTRSIVTVTARRQGVLAPTFGTALAAAFGLGIWAALVWVVWTLFATPPARFWPLAWLIALAIGAVAAISELRASGGLKRVAERLAGSFARGHAFVGSAANALAGTVIALGIPGSVILATGAWADVPPAEPGSRYGALGFVREWIALQVAAHPEHLVGRGLQLVLVALLASLPAALYFLFDRRKLGSLRDRFLRSVLILDPSLRTLEDVRSVHGARIDEVLGAAAAGVRRPVGVTRQVMVPLTTLLMALGWTLSLDPVGPAPAVPAPLLEYFVPSRDPLVFAFLGGYLFAIGLLLRRYVRSDLKPESLAHVLVRILGAVLIAWAVSMAWPASESGVLLVAAFVIGVFPESGLQWLQGFVRSKMNLDGPSTEERLPIDRLDGMNIYHRSRLMDEGVDNIENLAHADLFELLLETRFPMGTLVDWVDQAILLLHVGVGDGEADACAILREHGIRNATDLERVWQMATQRDGAAHAEENAFLGILGARDGGPPRLRLILDAIADDQWMLQLREVRKAERTGRTLRADMLQWWDEGEDRLTQEIERRRDADDTRRLSLPIPPISPTPPLAAETPPARA